MGALSVQSLAAETSIRDIAKLLILNFMHFFCLVHSRVKNRGANQYVQLNRISKVLVSDVSKKAFTLPNYKSPLSFYQVCLDCGGGCILNSIGYKSVKHFNTSFPV